MTRNTFSKSVFLSAILTFGVGLSGCATKTGTGALVGGLGGAAVGGAIGSHNGSAGKGALIGGAIGLIGGGLVGHAMDSSDQTAADKAQQERVNQRYESNRYASSSAAPRNSVTTEQVITWKQQGARDEIIIDRIERADGVNRLNAADEQRLRQQGVSDDVIYTMKEVARR